jgi:hypothetical protein
LWGKTNAVRIFIYTAPYFFRTPFWPLKSVI